MKTEEFGDKDMVSKCCGSDMVEPDWDMADNAGSMWRAYTCYICNKCSKACEAIELKDFREVLEFSPVNLSHLFKNVNHKPSGSTGYDFAWDITKDGIILGELFYCEEFRGWFFIKENYPMPRRKYSITFPINSIEFMIELFKSIGIELIKNV